MSDLITGLRPSTHTTIFRGTPFPDIGVLLDRHRRPAGHVIAWALPSRRHHLFSLNTWMAYWSLERVSRCSSMYPSTFMGVVNLSAEVLLASVGGVVTSHSHTLRYPSIVMIFVNSRLSRRDH